MAEGRGMEGSGVDGEWVLFSSDSRLLGACENPGGKQGESEGSGRTGHACACGGVTPWRGRPLFSVGASDRFCFSDCERLEVAGC